MRPLGPPHRRKHLLPIARFLLLLCAATTAAFLLWVSTANVDTSDEPPIHSYAPTDDLEEPEWSSESPLGEPEDRSRRMEDGDESEVSELETKETIEGPSASASCATVQEMGKAFAEGSEMESLRVRDVIRRHFDLHGASRVRRLPPDQFCEEGFVLGKASEAGFGNEMYKILTAAALSVMLNRSLIIGQTRGLYPFGNYITYTNFSFSLKEVKHLWRKNDCAGKYGRSLQIRLDNFQHPAETNVLCSDWRIWKQPIIWFQGTTDAVAIQFFLKNVNLGMRNTASNLFGPAGSLGSRPNVFGELLRAVVDPSQTINGAINWVLNGTDPDIALHMRMLTNRSIRAVKAAVMCVKRALHLYGHQVAKPRIVLVSDTPSFIKDITPNFTEMAEVLHFDYKLFESSTPSWRISINEKSTDFRVKDWGPAPRWVAFVDFFLASRAKHTVVSGAHRRVGTTYAQLIAALAAANHHGEGPLNSSFSFLSSFQSNLLVGGLAKQIGWGHAWNRFAGPLSCRHQPHQCAFTPLLPSAWWDGKWQSPIPRDIRRLQAFGVQLNGTGHVIDGSLESYCKKRKEHVKTIHVFGSCSSSKCF